MSSADREYLNLLRTIQRDGVVKEDRTGVGTRSIFGHQMRFNLDEGFPLLTTKQVHFKSIAYELLWFLSGSTNIRYLKDNGVSIWDEWADEEGELGPVYGYQWRHWRTNDERGEIDQIVDVMNQIRNNPDSRRMIVTAWNPADVRRQSLPPCHALFQFYVADGRLSCQMYQRSMDAFLGAPFNIASYALLTHMMAHQCDLDVGDFVLAGGDCHIYRNHWEQVNLQLSREPYLSPSIRFARKPESIFDYRYEDIVLENYQHHPKIAAPVAI